MIFSGIGLKEQDLRHMLQNCVLFKTTAHDLQLNHIGAVINGKTVRKKVVSHFILVYEFDNNEIIILAVFDTRQNPEKLTDRI